MSTERLGKVVSSVVYYIGDPDDQTIKIGSSTSLRQRLVTIRWRHRPRAVLLATEPGSVVKERQRHVQWEHLRVPMPVEIEWYRRNELLIAHVNHLRRTWGLLVSGPKGLDRSMISGL